MSEVPLYGTPPPCVPPDPDLTTPEDPRKGRFLMSEVSPRKASLMSWVGGRGKPFQLKGVNVPLSARDFRGRALQSRHDATPPPPLNKG